MHPVLRHAIIQRKCSRRQQGAVTLLVIISLPLMLLAMGWALDFGHVFVNKTRLQNALDATALSAAIAINGDVTHSTAAATVKGQATFNLFKAALGNNELSNLSASSLVFSYSKTLYPWGSFNSTTDTFAFVKITSTNMLNVTPVLIKVFNVFNKNITVPAIATAGPVGQNCTMMPFLLCADMTQPCNSTSCYGYNKGTTYPLIKGSVDAGKGNYGLLDLTGNTGANAIRDELEGKALDTACSSNISQKSGVNWGPVQQGIDYRVDTLDRVHNDYLTQAEYNALTTSEKNKLTSPTITSDPYINYLNSNGTGTQGRVMAVPIGNCSSMSNGSIIPIVGNGCLFINRHASSATLATIYVEFLGACQQAGSWSPINSVLSGPYKIVLFKSSSSPDS